MYYRLILDSLHRILILVLHLNIPTCCRVRHHTGLTLGDLSRFMSGSFIGLSSIRFPFRLLLLLGRDILFMLFTFPFLDIKMLHELLDRRDGIACAPVLPDAVLFGGIWALSVGSHFGWYGSAERDLDRGVVVCYRGCLPRSVQSIDWQERMSVWRSVVEERNLRSVSPVVVSSSHTSLWRTGTGNWDQRISCLGTTLMHYYCEQL